MAGSLVPPGNWWDADEEELPTGPGLNAAIPSPARMYDYYLGGKDNYQADREAAEKALSVVPNGKTIAQANRRFLRQAVAQMAEQGIRQFIDLGTGFPVKPSVHEVARVACPSARVLYVDIDPVVTAFNRALLTKGEGLEAICCDIREPYRIFASREMEQLIDLSQPVGVLFVAVLHFIPNEDDPETTVRVFTQRMVPGSYLALSHITSDGVDPDVLAVVQDAYLKASAPAVFRTGTEIQGFFSGFDLQPPGLADVTRWSPRRARAKADLPAVRVLAGLGRRTG